MIEFSDVTCSYGAEPLFSEVSLDFEPGAFHFLTGPSGAGKTSFIRLCHAASMPQSGTVRVFGTATQSLSRNQVAKLRRRIGVVHQDVQFLDHLSIAENIALPVTVSGWGMAEAKKNLRDLTEWVGLGRRMQAMPAQLSGGERQRAALARAAILSPDMILADEPTGNLDWEMSLRLLDFLVALNQMGKAVLIATHDLALIRAAKAKVPARVLRIAERRVFLAGAEL